MPLQCLVVSYFMARTTRSFFRLLGGLEFFRNETWGVRDGSVDGATKPIGERWVGFRKGAGNFISLKKLQQKTEAGVYRNTPNVI